MAAEDGPGRAPRPGAPADSLVDLHRWLDTRSRSIRLADLLIEVENDLGCSVHCQRPGETRVDPGDVCARLAAILAHGCNLGLYTLEKVAPASADRRLKDVSDWRRVEENPRAARAGIVHGLSRLDAAGHWGDGTTSASDGHRFAMPHKVLPRTSSTRVNDFALECYSFVADHDAPFSSRPIECTDRDAPVVLDGGLSHERDLDLDAHDTDTHGYTEISLAPRSARSLSFTEREEIAILRAQGAGVRDIARRLRRAPSTVSRELRRNAATRSGGLEYRASTAQWHSGIAPSVGTQGDAFDNALAESVVRALQDGGDSTTRPMADARGRGVRHIGVGGLVQHAAVAGADWRRAPGGVRSAIL